MLITAILLVVMALGLGQALLGILWILYGTGLLFARGRERELTLEQIRRMARED